MTRGRGRSFARSTGRARSFLAISGEQVLAQGLTQFLEPVTEMSDDGKVSGDGVLALRQVMDRDDRADHD